MVNLITHAVSRIPVPAVVPAPSGASRGPGRSTSCLAYSVTAPSGTSRGASRSFHPLLTNYSCAHNLRASYRRYVGRISHLLLLLTHLRPYNPLRRLCYAVPVGAGAVAGV